MSAERDIEHWVQEVREGKPRALARAITAIENAYPGAERLVDRLYVETGRAWRIGLTGPPGAGKSTLISQLVHHFRQQEKRVGVLAIDPSSPFTGGALLGDRIRMAEAAPDTGVFFRSLAARGALGGLSEATEYAADVLDAAGYEIILIETVGVGQSEIEVVRAVDTVVVVLVPESGDVIQTMKAGVMEIADIFCVNKADHAEADALVRALEHMLELRPVREGWRPPVVKTVATRRGGIRPLVEALEAHRVFLETSSLWKRHRRERLRRRVEQIVYHTWHRRFWNDERKARLQKALEALGEGPQTPYELARRLMKEKITDTTNQTHHLTGEEDG